MLVGEALNDGKTLYVQLVDDTAPLTAWIFGWVEIIASRSIGGRQVLALILIFFQAAFFAILLINNRAYNENTYLPALIFGILSFYSFDLFSFSSELLGSTVLLFALNNLFKEIEFRVQRDETLLNLGVYLGIASLLVFSYFTFAVGTLLILFVFTRMTMQKTFLLLFGFALPHLLLISFYFFWDNHMALFQNFYGYNFTFITHRVVDMKSILLLGLVPLTYLIFSLIMLNREAHFTKYQSQLLQVMFLWLLVAAAEAIITRKRTPHSFFTFIPPLAYFISHYLLLIRRKRIAEMMLWIFMIGIVSMAWASRTNKIKAIDFSGLFIKNQPAYKQIQNRRIMVLGDLFELYQQNKLGGYFLNWELARDIFKNPDYFENIILVDRSFQKDAPEVIVDQNNLMQPFFDRIPKWQLKYKREGNLYFKVSN